MKRLNMFIAAAMMASTVLMGSCKEDEVVTPEDPNKTAYDKADADKGGMMYDKFWAVETGFDQTNANIATLSASGDFFRCKQCHGWDGLGNQGAYISRGPKSHSAGNGRPNVTGFNLYDLGQTKTYTELYNLLKKVDGRRDISTDLSTYDPATNAAEGDKMPDLNQLLTDAQIWDLVKFLKTGMRDVSTLYDGVASGTYPTGTMTFSNWGKGGNEAAGNAYYTANCVACHGADGSVLDLEGMGVGGFTRKKANEAQHKIKFGALGQIMTGHFGITNDEMNSLYKALSNETNFPT